MGAAAPRLGFSCSMTGVEKADLKTFALNIVRGQTNVYIKELLRDNNVRIGATKEDFDKNLVAAIDEGVISREILESWLDGVEGWGQQHVYPFRLPRAIGDAFSTAANARSQVVEAGLGDLWERPTSAAESWAADEDLHLVSVTYDDSLRLHWFKGTQYWVRTEAEKALDKPVEEIDGFLYQFRAYRGRALREVMRFEIRPSDGMAALFVPQARGSKEHEAALQRAEETIAKLVDWTALQRERVIIADVIRNFDQHLSSLDRAARVANPQKTKLLSGVAYVEFGGVTGKDSYLDSPDVKRLRGGLRSARDIAAYQGNSAKFAFNDGLGTVELFAEGRIKLWSSLTADRVWHILRTLKAYEQVEEDHG